MIFTPAYAQGAGGGGGGEMFSTLAMMAVIFIIFYFLLIRPQQRRAKEHRDMIGALTRGDRVLTAGGILGKVVRVPKVKEGEAAQDAEEIEVEIAEGVRVKMYRSTITAVLAKTEPAKNS